MNKSLIFIIFNMFHGYSLAAINGIIEPEWLIEKEHHRIQLLIDIQWEKRFKSGSALTAITQAKINSNALFNDTPAADNYYSQINNPIINNQHSRLTLREFYLDANWFDINWRLGKQQVVWGQADGLKVLDVINPQSYQEFILDDFDQSRIPLWLANIEIPFGDESALQILWVPDTSYHELAADKNPFKFTSPKLVPALPTNATSITITNPQKPDHFIKDSDIGFKFSTFFKGWDISLNYLYHYQDFAVPYVNFSDGAVNFTADFKRNHLLGGTLSNVFGDFTLRAELGFNSHTYQLSSDLTKRGISESKEVSSVIGLDWQGISDTLISMQLFSSQLLNYNSDIIRDETEYICSFLLKNTFQNDLYHTELITLYSINNDDGLIRAKIKYSWQSNWDVWLGYDAFFGDKTEVFGQFDQQDRVVIGMKIGF